MTNRIGFLLMLVVFSYTISAQTNTIYFNTKLPGVKPEIFAKGVVSKDDQNEIQAFYSPDGNEFYLVIGWGEECVQFQKILRSKFKNGRWSSFDTIKYAKNFSFTHLNIDFKSNTCYFSSTMPTSGLYNGSENIWYSKLISDSITTPLLLDSVNSAHEDSGPFFIDDTLYFGSDRDVLNWRYEIYYYKDKLNKLNLKYCDSCHFHGSLFNPVFNKKKNMLLVNQKANKGFDIFIYFKKDGVWANPINLDILKYFHEEVALWSPILTPDEKYLIFPALRKDSSDLYWLDFVKLLKQFQINLD